MMVKMIALSLFGVAFLPSVLGSGFIGMGITMYKPNCAFACRGVIEMAMIDCDQSHDHDDMDMGDMAMKKRHGDDEMITPECRAMSKPFLSTLAYCLSTNCPSDTPSWILEKYWGAQATGDPEVKPMWNYEQSLMSVNGTPTATFDSHNHHAELNDTQLLASSDLKQQAATMKNFEDGEAIHVQYTLILLILGVGIPILTTFLTYLPFANRLIASIKPYVVYPALFNGRNLQPILKYCHIPTTGQSIFIAIFSIITIILTAVGYESVQPSAFMWYPSLYAEIRSKIAARTGVLAMGLAPLVLLFAGRNSILLWLTNWSHSTYLLLHRWVARLFTIQVILHSVLELDAYIASKGYAEALVEPWWIWGCVATVACSIMVVASVFRNLYYEIFILTHIILAVLVIVGTWYHLEYRFEGEYGYVVWMYIWFAVWAFDRVVRVVKMVKNGMRKASFRPVGDEILRVDIEGIKWDSAPGQHAYIFFPALRKFTPWENHPFSVIPTNYLRPTKTLTTSYSAGSGSDTPLNEKDLEELTPTSSATLEHSKTPTSGLTFFIKKNNGLTKHLWSDNLSTTTLVEGPYGGSGLFRNPILLVDRLILVAGGIGITAILPFAHAHPNVKVYWSMRDGQAAMAKELQPGLKHVEQDIVIGKRLDLAMLLGKEVAAGWKEVGVVVCGPGGMCDDIRREVVRVSKARKVKIELDVEAFSW